MVRPWSRSIWSFFDYIFDFWYFIFFPIIWLNYYFIESLIDFCCMVSLAKKCSITWQSGGLQGNNSQLKDWGTRGRVFTKLISAHEENSHTEEQTDWEVWGSREVDPFTVKCVLWWRHMAMFWMFAFFLKSSKNHGGSKLKQTSVSCFFQAWRTATFAGVGRSMMSVSQSEYLVTRARAFHSREWHTHINILERRKLLLVLFGAERKDCSKLTGYTF